MTELCSKVKGCPEYAKQLIRSASLIGANIAEAKYAKSNADFVRKLEIAPKEANETETWLSVLYKIGAIDEFTFKCLWNKCGKIRRMLIALSQQLNQNLTEKSNFAQNPKVQFAARMLHNNLQQHQSQLVFCKVGFFVAFLNSK